MSLIVEKEIHLLALIDEVADNLEIDVNEYKEKCLRHFSMNKKIDYDTYIQYALDEMDEANESWTYVASRLYLKKLYEGAAQNRNYEPKETYQHFYDLLVLLTEKGIYHETLLNKYSRAEIDFFGENLNEQNDNFFYLFRFAYVGDEIFSDRS